MEIKSFKKVTKKSKNYNKGVLIKTLKLIMLRVLTKMLILIIGKNRNKKLFKITHMENLIQILKKSNKMILDKKIRKMFFKLKMMLSIMTFCNLMGVLKLKNRMIFKFLKKIDIRISDRNNRILILLLRINSRNNRILILLHRINKNNLKNKMTLVSIITKIGMMVVMIF